VLVDVSNVVVVVDGSVVLVDESNVVEVELCRVVVVVVVKGGGTGSVKRGQFMKSGVGCVPLSISSRPGGGANGVFSPCRDVKKGVCMKSTTSRKRSNFPLLDIHKRVRSGVPPKAAKSAVTLVSQEVVLATRGGFS